MTKKLFISVLMLVSFVIQSLAQDAPLRRPISVTQPAWFVHIDNWNDADPQKIIDLIPEDIKPYVVFNISMSISHNETTGVFDRVPNGYQTARSWLRTCAENNVWAMVQCASGGFAHFSETDMRIYEEFYRDYPNFLGWNYAEQFWGFDDKFSCSFDARLNHFADLMKLARKYGGYTCISFCGNIWSRAESPLAMMKRNAAFAKEASEAPQNLIICDKYTCASMFYEYESMNFGSFVAGYTTNFGIRFDQCGWSNPSIASEAENMPAAAGVAPVLNNWLINGGTVNDGPELIWQQDFKTNGTKGLADGYTYRRFERFPQFDNVSIDLYRKILDGMVRIPTREEVIERTKLVLINNVNEGGEDVVYGAPDNLYDGLYNMNDAEHVHDQKNWFKKTGRYPTIPIVPKLVDDLAKSIPTKVNRSQLSSRWSTIYKKQTEFNNLYPEEYKGNAFAERVANRWLIYNPLKTGALARADIPFQFNTCESIKFTMSQYTTILMKEETEGISLYLNNYRTDVTSLKNDTIVIKGSTNQPSISWKDRSHHSASRIVSEKWDNGIYTLVVAHNGPLDIDIKCAGEATDRKTPFADRELVKPTKPALYTGPITHECEDFDYKNTNGYKLAPWGQGTATGFYGVGFADFGTRSDAAIRDTFHVTKAGEYKATIRYCAPAGAATIQLLVVSDGKTTSKKISLAKTATSVWKEFTLTSLFDLAEGDIEVVIKSYSNKNNLFLDQFTFTPNDYKHPTALNVDRYTLDNFSASRGEEQSTRVILNARSLSGSVSVTADGEFQVSTNPTEGFASSIDVAPSETGDIIDSLIYIRLNPEAEVGEYTGNVTFSAEGCLDHIIALTGTMNPQKVTLVYDFTDEKASTTATNPIASGVTKGSGSSTAGVYALNGDNVLKIYSTGGTRNNSGVLELEKFTSKATDYSVTWKQVNTSSSSDYKVGVLLRGGKVVGTSSAGYTQGIREGYVFITYNHPSASNSEFRIYKSTTAQALNMMVNQTLSVNPKVNTPMWYRATVSGTTNVLLTFEYSTDGVNWNLASKTTDSTSPFLQGSTQVVWGLAASQNNFCLDDITFEGITYDETVGIVEIRESNGSTNGSRSPRYTLQGMKVGSAYKGIVIENGRKVIVK